MMRHAFRPLVGLAMWMVGSTAALAAPAPVDYLREIRPILADNCYTCHGPDEAKRQAMLRLDLKEEALKEVIIPGKPDESDLIQRIAPKDPDDIMPPAASGKKLTPHQVDLLRRWVQEGAKWTEHWAFVKPARPPVPAVKDAAWAKNPIDRFILATLEARGLKPSPEADRATLLRRVSFDLTGLPPTPAELAAFLADKSPNAYEKVVDRLLASPHFGERMTQDWLDAARYADTNGYHIDNHRDLWNWRDWVIQAFNANKPFDQFTIEQIAGDMLPNATVEQKIATGFNRNEMVNFEGGAIEEEYASKYVVGRVATTSTVFLGLTMACAECHDHKYDPISAKDFYRFYAFFNNVAEKGLDGQSESPAPLLKLPTPEQSAQLAKIHEQIASLEQAKQRTLAELATRQAQWEQQARARRIQPAEPPNLLARYAFDEPIAMRIADSAGGAVAFRPGKLGNAVHLDGKGGSIEVPSPAPFDRTTAFSYGAWVWLEDPNGSVIARMDNGPTLRGFDLTVIGQRPYAHLIHEWEKNAIRVIGKRTLPLKTWQHLLVTYDGSGKAAGLRIYVNGQLDAVDADRDTLTGTIVNDKPLRLGRREQGLPFKGMIDDVRLYGRALAREEIAELLAEPALAIAAIPPEERSDPQKAELANYYRQRYAGDIDQSETQVAALRKQEQELDRKIVRTMVMQEREPMRETNILVRGDYRNKGERVTPGVPGFLPPLPAGMKPDRLALAKWLADPNHPLVARVTVNRFWQHYFGAGIVSTVNDFGSRSELPSHPALLDFLAVEFIASKWDIKAMQRLIVTSAAYRQSAVVRPDLLQIDPANRLLARGPRFRLSAEEIRDNALAVSGLLNPVIGGPSVFPYQPAGLWEAGAFGGNFSSQTYVQSHGPDLYRRGIYTYWKRSMPYPSFTSFDAPNRELCIVQRPRTNTPLQALVLLNDPVYVEAARALAQRIMKEAPADPPQRIAHAFRLVLARPPQSAELQVLLRLHEQQLAAWRKNPANAAKLISVGESRRDTALDPAELAAWTAVANAILNLDETVTKG